jgi:predicted MFS family arabinose efflux permease
LSAGPSLLSRSAEDAADVSPNPVLHSAGNQPAARPVAGIGGLVWLVGLAVMIMFIGDSASTTWSPIFLSDQLTASAAVVPLGLGAYLGFQLVGRTIADRMISRAGAIATLIGGSLVAAAGFAVVATAPNPPVAIAGFALVGAGLSVVVPLAFSAADALDPAGTGTVIARVNLFNYAGVVIGAALIGIIKDTAGLRIAFAVPAVLVLLICVLAPSFRLLDLRRTR